MALWRSSQAQLPFLASLAFPLRGGGGNEPNGPLRGPGRAKKWVMLAATPFCLVVAALSLRRLSTDASQR